MSDTPLPVRYAPTFMRVWGNMVTINTNSYDITLLFDQRIADDMAAPFMERQVAVGMSWQGAKALAGLLTSMIQAHEQQTGERLLPSQGVASSSPAEA